MLRWIWILLIWGCAAQDAEQGLEEEFLEGPAPAFSGKADEHAISYRQVDFPVDSRFLETPARRTFTSASSFKRFFGQAPSDESVFENQWVIFYTPGTLADVQEIGLTVRLAPSAKSLQVTTELVKSGEGCEPLAETQPYMLVSIPDPNFYPGSVRYYAQETDRACSTGGCDSILGDLSNVTEDFWFTSESDYPFSNIFLAGATGLSSVDLAVEFGFEGELIEEWDYDWFVQRKTTEEDWMDEWYLEELQRYRDLDAVLRSKLTNLRIVRFSEIEIHFFIVGETECGDTAGLRTISIET